MGGLPVIIAAMEYGFMGGSMGSVVGEKITRARRAGPRSACPLIVISCSGGARMQEGALSLMQMAKISAALARLDEAGLPYISVLTDPTTGGVTASFAMLGDLNIAEPKALIGFAGPRVIEQTIRQKLPTGFQRTEFLLEHGMLDLIVERSQMRDTLIQCLQFMIGATKRADVTSRGSEKKGDASAQRSARVPGDVGDPALAVLAARHHEQRVRQPIQVLHHEDPTGSSRTARRPRARRAGRPCARRGDGPLRGAAREDEVRERAEGLGQPVHLGLEGVDVLLLDARHGAGLLVRLEHAQVAAEMEELVLDAGQHAPTARARARGRARRRSAEFSSSTVPYVSIRGASPSRRAAAAQPGRPVVTGLRVDLREARHRRSSAASHPPGDPGKIPPARRRGHELRRRRT